MKAIMVNKHGGPEVLNLVDIDEPTPQEGEVKIRVHAFGLNKIESYVRNGDFGDMTPFVPGVEAVGEVVDDTTGKFSTGQKVVTAMGGTMFERPGTYSEYVIANAASVLAIDSDISYSELAALPIAYLTTWGALDKSTPIRAGDSLLIRGATSSVGLSAVIYAKHKGYKVIATTRNPANREKLLETGADEVIIDDGEIHEAVRAIEPEGVDYALEVVGVGTIKDTFKCVKPFGEVVVVGLLSGPPVIDSFHLMRDLPPTVKMSFFGAGIIGTPAAPIDDCPLTEIAEKVQNGELASSVVKVFNIDEIQDAHRQLDASNSNGKIVVQFKN